MKEGWRSSWGALVVILLLAAYPPLFTFAGEKDDTALIARETHWGRPGTLKDHFMRHGADFGAKSPREYAEMAFQFYRKAQEEKFPRKVDSDGTIRIYDPKTNTFGAYNSDGMTKTFFKPKDGKKYWQRQ